MTINELENQEERNREECERCSKKEKEERKKSGWGKRESVRKKKAFSELFNWNRNGYRIGYNGRS